LAIAATLYGAIYSHAQSLPDAALRDGFKQPTALDRLCCYWQWLKGNTTEQSITRDLEGMKSHGYGGAILVDADGSDLERTAEKKTRTCFRSCGYAIF
jgi:hypothetical protein